MQYNNFNERQKRITIIKFFGELYCFQIIENGNFFKKILIYFKQFLDILFLMLYKLIEFGHENPEIKMKSEKNIDPPEDTFRITLICTLLESVKIYLTPKKMKRNVDRFLAFFQKYILSKNYLPMLLEFMVLDIFEFLNPDMVVFKSLTDATEACDKIIKVVYLRFI